MRAVGYLRKSRVTSDRHLSWAVQEAEIRQLAARHGDEDFELLSDWGRSGRGEKTRLRPGFKRLRELVASGEVSVLYSYSLSRLARSLQEYASLAELCRDHGVKVRLCKEGEFEYTTATGRLIVDILARFAQFEAELGQERASETIKVRRARGDYIGVAPYGMTVVDSKLVPKPTEDVSVVIDAFRQSGSFHSAANRLNGSGFPTRHGTKWSERTVRAVVLRAAPETPTAPTRRGPKPKHTYLFQDVLRCHCGQVMTPRTDTRRNGVYISYLCWRARYDASHPRPFIVAETRIRPWVEAEAARLRAPAAVLVGDEKVATDRLEELAGRRKRILDNYEDGYIDRDERDRKLVVIDAEMQTIDAAGHIAAVPPLDWSWPPARINDVLRAIFEAIQLDERMQPVSATWAVPEWRAA